MAHCSQRLLDTCDQELHDDECPVPGRSYNLDFYSPRSGWYTNPTTEDHVSFSWINMTWIIAEETRKGRTFATTSAITSEEADARGWATS